MGTYLYRNTGEAFLGVADEYRYVENEIPMMLMMNFDFFSVKGSLPLKIAKKLVCFTLGTILVRKLQHRAYVLGQSDSFFSHACSEFLWGCTVLELLVPEVGQFVEISHLPRLVSAKIACAVIVKHLVRLVRLV